MPHGSPSLAYRPDVDGLRAVAVLGVLFYHFGFWQVPGGFVGVDVFFVVSGFLITGLILNELAAGRFTIRGFYERRIRRIFPALFAMLLAPTIAAGLLLFPVDFASYARSLIATSVFAANIEFWRSSGYFDLASLQKPLLHLWSIAVEEQFYLFFPVLLIWTPARHRRHAMLALFVGSLAFSAWAVRYAPSAAFYLLPSRVWELMLGALLATGFVAAPRAPWQSEALAWSGVAMIVAAMAFYQPWQPFPGIAALLPCLGTAFVILTGSAKTSVARLLSLKPVVFIGLVSYSLYLWHWPILIFARNLIGGAMTPVETWSLMALSLAVACLSWRYIEQPFRRGFHFHWRPLFGGAATAMAAAAAFGTAVASANGMPERWQPEIRSILAEETDNEPRRDACFGLDAQAIAAGGLCHIGSPRPASASFLLWGDSHADALLPAVDAAAQQRGEAGLFAGSGSCAPLLGTTRSDAPDCVAFNNAVLRVVLASSIREVILDARWSKNANDPDSANGGGIVLSDDQGRSFDKASMQTLFRRGLERTVRLLTGAGKRVVIVAPVPEAGYSVPRMLAQLRLAGNESDLNRDLSSYFQRQGFVLATLADMARLYGARVIYPHRILCATGRCEFVAANRPLYRDEHHLSVFGAMRLTPLVAEAL